MASVSISAGDLDQRVTLQQRVTSTNALGESQGAWADVATLWAKVQPLRARDQFAAGQAQILADIKVTVRYRDGVTGAMRVMWRGQPLEIVGEPVDVGGARVMLEILCLKGARDGR